MMMNLIFLFQTEKIFNLFFEIMSEYSLQYKIMSGYQIISRCKGVEIQTLEVVSLLMIHDLCLFKKWMHSIMTMKMIL